MKNQGKSGKFTEEIHPFGVTTLIPLVNLVEVFKIASEDELDDYPELDEQVEHLSYFLAESARTLRYFGIQFCSSSDTLAIWQFFPGTPPDNHTTLLIEKLRRYLDIVGNAGVILDKYVCFGIHDHQAHKDFLIESFVSSYEATMYFIKFMQSEGDDTAFDYHGSYTEIILETLILFLD